MPFSSVRTWLQPDLFLNGSVLSITPELLARHQLQGLVLDVDDTLVSTRNSEVSPEVTQWLLSMQEVATVSLVSNNLSRTRIRRIGNSLDLPYTFGARKPSRRKLRQAVAAMSLPTHRVAMVGDRIFTDVVAGNRLGMFTILVEPMGSPQQASKLYCLRNFEIWISQQLGATLKS
ncbi:YqeG family HAD IIIA-type phosphatase [Synechococcales cyanobacterium C]|uniref:YqeG family HAD IIIA-type phosphatase n=1 Tax=Petrachloros mirabilis ULC683 TaxID=2781853 RepID=A0A8K2A8T7_9CYAN|nr:YqeG family HAD IIIA-type phosphatase [Petrachloros mirabilis]NCJ08406.1 YqeG family HAD IIIA-type phosphatase [Petrachloros mirabilis ULC683]